MSKPNLQSLLLGSMAELEPQRPSEQTDQRARMRGLLSPPAPTPPPVPQAPEAPSHQAPPPQASTPREAFVTREPMREPAHFSALVPGMISLKGQILHELHTNIAGLLKLNPSRREAVAQYLDRLARHQPAPSMASGAADAGGGLRRWLEGPRSPAQNAALQTYFEELALLVLGQAILVKTWSDRGIRRLSEGDLGRLNWAISTALKPHIPPDREGWQLTRPNLYSWYTPSQVIQSELWLTLSSSTLVQDGPSLLSSLLGPARQNHPDRPREEPQGYDPRFYKAIWDVTHSLCPAGSLSGVLKRERVFFSPTLRDGSLARTGPQPVLWIGMEGSPFKLMVAELMQLFQGPASPPLWSVGSGLEAHSRDQLTLSLGSPKPSLISRIAEMEACDVAVVLEEKPARARLREQLEAYPALKRLKGPQTTLGGLQACIAIGKLRPGGLLWWAREEPLSSEDGSELLGHLLERGKLLCHWDFSGLEHNLPAQLPLFSKHLYLFAREPRLEERLSHRPQSVVLRGPVRSHVEIPLVLEDALAASTRSVQPRGQWQVHAQKSPNSQKDWAERWPDPASHSTLHAIERLRGNSIPLAGCATIRPVPEGDPTRQYEWSIPEPVAGLWLRLESNAEGRQLAVQPVPRPGREGRGSGFLMLLRADSWTSPLAAYLRLPIVRDWLDHHAERKSDRWILNEQVVRWIPIPKLLVERIERGETRAPGENFGEWSERLRELPMRPREFREALERERPSDPALHVEAFVQAARTLAALDTGQSRLLGVVSADGSVAWGKLVEILPATERVGLGVHPKLRITGSLPPHIPVARVERVKAPQPGILLATELGPFLRITSESPVLLEMAWDQLKDVSHHTWSEIVQSVKLPRRLELAEATAADLVRLHAEQNQRLRELSQLLTACTLY